MNGRGRFSGMMHPYTCTVMTVLKHSYSHMTTKSCNHCGVGAICPFNFGMPDYFLSTVRQYLVNHPNIC